MFASFLLCLFSLSLQFLGKLSILCCRIALQILKLCLVVRLFLLGHALHLLHGLLCPIGSEDMQLSKSTNDDVDQLSGHYNHFFHLALSQVGLDGLMGQGLLFHLLGG